ncbi:hypothetical protein COW36_20400 [bacterium (Candidatus Blackallbacteria) CG17_big_fil_post_rev_8_21_14_2_50_48_46]|uniref:TIGR03790 family protein n=1 Tax=bacterium (Candidatus Blackallbacteria) CG17_big_fil_post_rev_8_21_14_2_50_48_46 TaxID=2014261 RepID=A0A2M7FZD9_9BACT|nr:MAG: hypothetical protein COW64_22725 [bacterium (Candidatus Blackallbacteria) CG18_big_fil_WC_8_21_14_2_50_49_26]PIW14766.1 MAG: hypothetical protein COW36_20400 [bacterium (Candidatus Blackallbacteria) CG17_big_fil_post_rev_8_21_14_2_50_48_46]PIW50868.1 MAG: hypothetical protein COW20_01215 [bacterium (Candidatus Blackallbacteria) CG13_big_fil_rev_8_21_14_2_50_49_14]
MKRMLLAVLCAGLTGILTQGLAAEPLPAASLYVAIPFEGLEPVALLELQSQKLKNPPENLRESLDYFQKNLPLGSDLELFLNGEVKNMFYTGPYQEPAPNCRSFGSFQGKFKHADKNLTPLLAFSAGFPGPRKFPGAYPSHHFDQQARKMTLEAYRRHGVKGALLNQIRIRRITPFLMENGASTQFAVSSVIGGGTNACPSHSLLLVIEKMGRRYLTRVEKYRADLNQGKCFAFDFISSFATGPVVDKLLLQGTSRTARWYEVLQRQNTGNYQTVFTGGGKNCLSKKNN